MTTEAQIYAIGTCAIGIFLNPLSCPACQSINYDKLCKTNPILSAVGGLQMNLTSLITVDYENKSNWTLGENKPNTNPIQTQYKPNTNPIKPKTNPKQTQNEPNQTQSQECSSSRCLRPKGRTAIRPSHRGCQGTIATMSP